MKSEMNRKKRIDELDILVDYTRVCRGPTKCIKIYIELIHCSLAFLHIELDSIRLWDLIDHLSVQDLNQLRIGNFLF